MSADLRLREFARWDQAGPSGKAKLLRERMRAGALSEERVRLAAWLGDPASALVCAAAPSPRPTERAELRDWVQGLRHWGKEPCLRAALAACRCVLGPWSESRAEDRTAPDLVQALESWLVGALEVQELRRLNASLQHGWYGAARYARAIQTTLSAAIEDVGSGDPVLLYSDLPVDVAHDYANQIHYAGGTARVESGAGAAANVWLLEARGRELTWALTAGDSPLPPRKRELLLARGFETYDMLAAQAVRQAALPLWHESLTPAAVAESVARELVPWALGLPAREGSES